MKRTALVTGANRGLGLALCEQLVVQGYEVFALCRRVSPELLQLDLKIIDNVDIANFDQVLYSINNLSVDSLDLLINNAAIGLDDDWENIDFELVKNQFIINAFAPLFLTHALRSRIVSSGKIAFITSRMGSIGANSSGGSYAYRMSKAALNMLGKNLSLDLKDHGIAVGIFSPGQVDTDMLRELGINTGRVPCDVAKDLLVLINRLNLENSGSFWHVDGQILPW